MRYLFFIFIIISISCNNNSENVTLSENNEKINDSINADSEFIDEFKNNYADSEKSINDSIKINFDEFKLFIKNYYPDTIYFSKNKDSLYIEESIGESIEGKLISVYPNNNSDFKFEQSFVNSLLISNEGPLCAIENWKTYKSPFLSLKLDSTNYYKTKIYDYDSFDNFPSVSADEIQKIVKLQCNENYLELIKNIKSVHEGPCEVYKSNYIIKVTYKKSKPKYIYITSIPGC